MHFYCGLYWCTLRTCSVYTYAKTTRLQFGAKSLSHEEKRVASVFRTFKASNMLPDWYFSRIWNFQEKVIKIIIFPEVSILHYFEARSFVNRKYSSKSHQTQQLTVRFGFSIKIWIFEKCFLKFSFFSKFSFFLPNLKFGFPFYRIPILPRKKVQLQKS